MNGQAHHHLDVIHMDDCRCNGIVGMLHRLRHRLRGTVVSKYKDIHTRYIVRSNAAGGLRINPDHPATSFQHFPGLRNVVFDLPAVVMVV